MSDSLKDDVVNNAIEFTRTFRPVVFSSKTGEPLIPVDHMTLSYQELSSLNDLCISIQKFLYGEECNESDEHKNGEDIQSGKD